MQTMTKPIIASIKRVSKKFDDQYALREISLEIHEGEVLSILGPNGAGKTTLINLMLGRLALTEGYIELLNFKPGDIKLKRQCGAMLQVSSLPDMSTVKEHILLFQSYYASPMDYHQLINLAGLKEIENSYSKNLSGGQKQRLLFALSICGNPKILFLDEPSVGMDITARKSLWQAINDLKRQGTSVILTTHYLEEADQLSDRIIMLNKGQVIQQGTPNEIKSQIDRKTIRFSSSVAIESFANLLNHSTISVRGNFFEIQTKNPALTMKKILSNTDDIRDLSINGAGLEDAFLLLNQQNDSRQERNQ